VTKGFFLLHRELFDKLWFRQLGAKGIGVIYLIARAQWGEGTLKNGRVLARGQCVVGRKEFAKATGLTEQEVRTLLINLENVRFLTTESTSEGTVVTINNYEYYQEISNFLNFELTSNQPPKQPAINQPSTNDQPLIKENKTNKEDLLLAFDRLWAMYPRKLGRKAAERHFKASVKNPKDLADLELAIRNYLAEIQANGTEERYIKHGATFFCNWRDYVTVSAHAPQHDDEKRLRTLADVRKA
jgi:hypothetical protein